MQEAKKKHQIKDGLKPGFTEAIGLVETCVAFEAFINELLYEKSISKKINHFSNIYQITLTENLAALKKWIVPLKKELDEFLLTDMTPNSNRRDIGIDNPEKLENIIWVIYRVRSNLVHGSKSIDSPRNEILIGNSFHFLYSFLEIIFNKEEI